MLAHICLPFCLIRWKSTQWFNSEQTWRTDIVDSSVSQYAHWFVLLAWMSRLLTFPWCYVRTENNQLMGSILSELGATDVVDSVAAYVQWFVLFACMSPLLIFPCNYVPLGTNQLTGSIWSKLGAMTMLVQLYLRTCIRSSCWHECHACSHFLAVIFDQMKINSLGQFQVNSENWHRWLICFSVRGLVCLVPLNVTLAHISLINLRGQFRANSEHLLGC
jgi:hypothetical protein